MEFIELFQVSGIACPGLTTKLKCGQNHCSIHRNFAFTLMPRLLQTLVQRRPNKLLALDKRREISLSRLASAERQLPR